mmetsp:Transcript_24532/g.45775  ORF Transcript_24532/g.45775 Transcript_24532/m.45775 type:complete len:208 (-) Transcript_24532:178-801(-)
MRIGEWNSKTSTTSTKVSICLHRHKNRKTRTTRKNRKIKKRDEDEKKNANASDKKKKKGEESGKEKENEKRKRNAENEPDIGIMTTTTTTTTSIERTLSTATMIIVTLVEIIRQTNNSTITEATVTKAKAVEKDSKKDIVDMAIGTVKRTTRRKNEDTTWKNESDDVLNHLSFHFLFASSSSWIWTSFRWTNGGTEQLPDRKLSNSQ